MHLYKQKLSVEYLISKGVEINFKHFRNISCIDISFNNEDFHLIFVLLYFGSYLPSPNVINNKISHPELALILSDYKEGTLWNKERTKYFPSFVNKLLFYFLISTKIYLRFLRIKIQKDILLKIFQCTITNNIKQNFLEQKLNK